MKYIIHVAYIIILLILINQLNSIKKPKKMFWKTYYDQKRIIDI